MFSDCFEKDSKPYTSSVSQDIHSNHSHLDRYSLPVSPERDGDLAHTQQFLDYLSLFHEGEQSGGGQHVLSNLHFRVMEGKERSNPCCHHATRGEGRKHTGKNRKLEISKGVVNILQCNVTTWSELARHHILTSDFDATLISEIRLTSDGLLSAVTEAKKSGWAGTGSAATNTVNNGTSAGVLTLVRKRWFSKPLSICSDDAGILCPNPRLAGRVIRVMGREILLLTAYFEHSVRFRSDINANLIHDVCFLTRDGRLPFIFGADFNFPPDLWQDLSLHGGGIWTKQLGASVVIPEGSSHTCRTGRGQKPDIIDYFMVSACIRPLIQKCEVIKSVPWGPHCGVKLVLNIDLESVWKISRRNHHKVGATLEGSDADLLDEADPSPLGSSKTQMYFRRQKASL